MSPARLAAWKLGADAWMVRLRHWSGFAPGVAKTNATAGGCAPTTARTRQMLVDVLRQDTSPTAFRAEGRRGWRPAQRGL